MIDRRGIGLFFCAATSLALIAGCGKKEEAAATPASVKAAMGGHYSPEVMAQAQAYRMQDMQKNAQMTQNKGVPAPGQKTSR